ncbi:DUF4381 domain-containing protein [Dyella acidiphila]|uniref:DUF4381 domain-containing protein n=1 Tax=Dyella acidiphila TaxID=2775866 RepID=A0ABR9G4H5_9GAMM|nr:DUF4381 domain-containing protein [Dyella acidiphila]MBE1158934.1 DUF4381 domain-containing protein [Dyella acidiphila]
MSGRFPQSQDGLVLRDIHLPPAPSWWPPAPGWWLVSGAVCVIALAAYWLYRNTRNKRIVRQRIVAEIELAAARHPQDDAAYAAALHQLLRRAARRYAVDAHSAQGERWKQVLAYIPVDAATLDALMTLDARMYRPHADFDRVRVQAAAHRWLDSALKQRQAVEVERA